MLQTELAALDLAMDQLMSQEEQISRVKHAGWALQKAKEAVQVYKKRVKEAELWGDSMVEPRETSSPCPRADANARLEELCMAVKDADASLKIEIADLKQYEDNFPEVKVQIKWARHELLRECCIMAYCGAEPMQLEYGIECPEATHFICNQCFDQHVATAAEGDPKILKEREGHVQCPCCDQFFADTDVAAHVTPGVFKKYEEQRRSEMRNREWLSLHEHMMARMREMARRVKAEAFATIIWHCHTDKGLEPYSPELNVCIESAFQANTGQLSFNQGSFSYKIDLQRRVQINQSTRVERRIERHGEHSLRPATSATDEFPPRC